jgi:autotransporter-associated beta strand protein
MMFPHCISQRRLATTPADFPGTSICQQHYVIGLSYLFQALIWLSLLAIAGLTAAHANVAGGVVGISSTYPAVTITTNASAGTVTMANGLVTAVIDIATAQILTLTYQGYQVTDGGTAANSAFYWQGQNSVGEQTATFGILSIITNPASNSGTMGDIMISDLYSNHTTSTDSPDDAYRHFTMFQGSPGIYVTQVMARPSTYPAGGADIPSMTGKLTTAPFDWIAQDSGPQNTLAPSDTTTSVAGVNSCPKEVTLMANGVLSGRFDCKYNYAGDLGMLSVTGWCSNKETSSNNIGLWVIRPSAEYNSSGPKHPEIQTQIMNLNVTFKAVHFGFGSDLGFAAGETWSHVCGPFFIYLNKQAPTTVVSGSNPELTGTAQVALFADAQAQAAAEKGAWPYSWLNDSHYVQASGRGTVAGKLVISDTANPFASASNMWVGVAQQPSSTTSPAPTDFQSWAKTYQFWTKTDANGNFTIPNVIAGTNYTLFAFGQGAIGQFQSQPLVGATNTSFTTTYPATSFSVAVNAGSTTSLGSVTWPALRGGPTAFEIGTMDRDTTEFRHGQDYWHGDLGTAADPASNWNPYLNYPLDFPNGLTYSVGTSIWSRDWNYCMPVVLDRTTGDWNGATQNINFLVPKAPPSGAQATLYFSIAADDNGTLVVNVNGTNISNPSTGYYLSNSTNDAMIRMESHGIWSDLRVNFAASLLKTGTNINVIQVNQRKGGYFANGILFDYIRLEVPGYVPPAPASLTLISGKAQTVLNWPPAAGATSYTILRSTTSGTSGYSLLASNVAGPVCGSTFQPAGYLDTTASNGTIYYYEVESVNVSGSSAATTFASGAPSSSAPGVPAAPTGLTLSDGNEQALLNWTASSGASYYLVERAQTSGGPYSVVDSSVTSTSCTDTGLSNTEPYYYVVAAVNASGTSAVSTQVSAAPMPSAVTQAPSNITAALSGGYPYLSWGGVSGATNYIVQSSTNAAGPYTELTGFDVTDFYQDTSAAPASTYYYEIAAANVAGESAFTAPISVVTQSAAPTSPTAIPGNTQVSLTWGQISGVSGYVVVRGTANGGPYATLGSSVGGAYTDTGLTNAKTYYYEVAGVNNSGTGAFSSQVSATPLAAVPLAPASLSATGGDFQVSLNWTPSAGATGYTVYEGVQTGGPYTAAAAGVTGTTFTDTQLAPDTTYYYVVQATNTSGSSAYSNEASATTISHASSVLTWDASGSNPVNPTDGSGTWDTSSLLWSTGTNDVAWNNTTGAGAQIGNNNGATGTITVSGNISAAELLISPATSGSYTLTSGTLTLSGSAPVIGVNANTVVATTLTGTGDVQIFGNSVLTVTGSNNFASSAYLDVQDMEVDLSGLSFTTVLGTAPIELDNSSLVNISYSIGGGSVSTSVFSNPVVVPDGQTGSITFSGRNNWGGGTFDTPVTGSGTLNLYLTNPVSGGAIRASLYADFSAFAGQINVIGTVAGDGFFYYMDDGGNTADKANGSANAQWNFGGAGSTTFSVSPQTTGNTMYLGSLSGGTNATFNGGSGGTVTYSMGALGLNSNFQGTITGNAAVTKTGIGTQILSGTCNYTKTTTVQAGVLEITGTIAGTSAVSISNGAALSLQGGSLSVIGNITNNGLFKIAGSPSLSLTGTFINQGVLDLINGPQTLPSIFVNNGVVLYPSSVQLTNLTFSNSNGTTLTMQGYAQHTYQLQKTTSVTAPVTWTNVGSAVTGTGGAIIFADPAASGSSTFYRVQVSP